MPTVIRHSTGSFVAKSDDQTLAIQPHQIVATLHPNRPTELLAAKKKPRRSQREIHDLLSRGSPAS